jgi:multidrug efflux pump subunit AcrA (membrane-fusion protein)
MTESTNSRSRFTFAAELMKYIVSAVILALGFGGMLYLKTLAQPPADTKSDLLVPLVKTYAVEPYSGQLDMVVSGSVVPYREIKIAAEVGGRVKVKHPVCQAGQFVTKGTPLIQVDPEDYELEIKTLQSDVKQAEKLLEETLEEIRGTERNIVIATNEFELQQRDFERNKRLSGVLSNSELDAVERGLLASQAQLTTRKNTLAMLQARKARLEASRELSESQLNKALLNLKRTTIEAPDDGIIVRDMVEQGDYVAPGTQVVLFEDTSRAEIVCNLTAGDLDWIRKHSAGSKLDLESQDELNGRAVYRLPKTPVSIFDTSEPDVVWQGVLERFDGIGRDELTKSIPCRIVIENPVVDTPHGQRALVRGMYVKCRMEVQTSTAAEDQKFLTFPEVALRPGDFVWIVRDHKLARAEVEIADRNWAMLDDEQVPFVIVALTKDGLQPGDEVVRTPLSQPTEGAKVLLEGELSPSRAAPDDEKISIEKTADASDEPTTS